ncbi:MULTISPECIES: hypothetical protein [unclassified Moorena]|uniref:hypothetical protein n=1 Tax=unclassified Moorena TaxID=2683338 RepID=UPI0013B699A2|nr:MULTISPECIES: hypothetical protein [unclassified Moorena]NER91633.1 hypothetical protein [Moorena sp. SIO3A2]NET63285.1 hypothetical protein [Moorena sp. SIO1G6]
MLLGTDFAVIELGIFENNSNYSWMRLTVGHATRTQKNDLIIELRQKLHVLNPCQKLSLVSKSYQVAFILIMQKLPIGLPVVR